MDVGHFVFDASRNRIRDVDEMPRGDRIEKVLAAKIAVAKVKAELDIVGHRCADAGEAVGDFLL